MSIWYDKKGKEYASKGKISWIKVYAEYLVKNLRDEILAKLNFHYDGLEGRHSAENIDFNSELDVKSAIEKETNQRITVDTSLQASIDAETLQRSTADTSLQTAIETEVSARKENDNALQTLINNETENRSNADQLLQQNIDDEVSERINSDNNLQSQIDSEKQKLDNLFAKVLTKDNTTAYSPTSNYHPATKKYVDDIAMKAGTGDMLTSVYDMNGNGIVDNAEKLGGYAPSYFASQAFVNSEISNLENQLNTPPELTEVSPDGTILGSDGWTGTGYVSLENNVRVDYKRYQVSKYTNSDGSISNKYSPFTQVHGFQRFCLRFADPSGNKWKNWTPWIDIDGVAYEFFYSPTRKLYEALIPATDKLAEEIVSEIRWEREEPDVIRYGKVAQCCAVGYANNGTTPVYSFFTDEASLRDNSGAYCTLDKNILGEIVNGNISAPIVDNINLLAKLHLQIDVSSSGSLSSATHLISVSQLIVGTITELPIDTIDNFA